MEHGLNVIDGGRVQMQEMPDIMQEMNDIIEDVDQYAQARGTNGGLDWGMPSFNKAFDGLNTGLHIIGGQPNVGKSSLCMQAAWSIAKNNKQVSERCHFKSYVLYISLDDTARDILPRVVANEKRIPIRVVQKPGMYIDHPNGTNLLTRRNDGINKLKQMVPYFKIVDSNYIPGCECIETIKNIIAKHNTRLKSIDESYKLVVFIDNMHDIGSAEINFRGDDNAKFNYISNELTSYCNTYDIPIICTAEFRKLNGSRRPTMDDVKESGKIAYEAKAIILCYNEVGLRGNSAQIYWEKPGEINKQPVLEAHVIKNKYSEFKNRLYFEFMPEQAFLKEASEEGARNYHQMIMG